MAQGLPADDDLADLACPDTLAEIAANEKLAEVEAGEEEGGGSSTLDLVKVGCVRGRGRAGRGGGTPFGMRCWLELEGLCGVEVVKGWGRRRCTGSRSKKWSCFGVCLWRLC